MENCYIWVDLSKSEEERNVNILCEKCHESNPDLGWFWEGSKLGYGPFDFICSECKHVIHEGKK